MTSAATLDRFAADQIGPFATHADGDSVYRVSAVTDLLRSSVTRDICRRAINDDARHRDCVDLFTRLHRPAVKGPRANGGSPFDKGRVTRCSDEDA